MTIFQFMSEHPLLTCILFCLLFEGIEGLIKALKS